MSEQVADTPALSSLLEISRFSEWENQPDSVIRAVSLAFSEQRKKPQQVMSLENPQTREGIHLMPRWAACRLLRVGQRRGLKDLFPRGGSYHNVSFGIVELRKPDGTTILTSTAVKTFDAPGKALHDAAVNGIVLERSFSTTDPICVIAAQPKSYVISLARTGVQALDTEPWHQFSPTLPELQSHFQHRLQQVAETLAAMHLRGINHGDAKLRNYWATPQGTVEPFDWESARIFPDPPSSDDLCTISRDDLGSLWRSIQTSQSGVAFLRGSEQAKLNSFSQLVFQPYFKSLLAQVSQTGDEKLFAALADLEHLY